MPNLVGIGNSQVPTNAMLGGLAYQDSVGEIDIDKIKARTGDTATDVFVYDTRKDSDGGAWRHRTQKTSWYNEVTGTHRGARKEFPAVAVLVVTSGNMTIYDGDDPTLPMWMIFTSSNTTWLKHTTNGPKSVVAMNGNIVTCGDGSAGRLSVVNFISDDGYVTEAGFTYRHSGIITRNSTGVGPTDTLNPLHIVNINCNDVAITVLPNAPIDESTGLPRPTIAVATDGGTNVINNDGKTVTQGYQTIATEHVDLHPDGFMTDGISGATNDSFSLYDITQKERVYSYGHRTNNHSIVTYLNEGTGECLFEGSSNKIAIAQSQGLLRIVERIENGTSVVEKANDAISLGLHNRTTSSYNTGWMAAESKGAFLSDTDTTDITDTQAVTNPGPFTSTTGWAAANAGWSVSDSNNRLVINSGSQTSSYFGAAQTLSLTDGRQYVLVVDIHSQTKTAVIRLTADGNYFTETGLGTGEHAFYFTANQASHSIFIGSDTGGTNREQQVSSVTIREVEEDRSAYDKGLQVFGTVTKSAVATGAELVSYGPFSTSNRLRQPYNSDLNVETNDFSIMFWMYNTGTNSHQTLVSRDDREFDVSILDNTTYSRRFRIYADQSGNTSNSFDSTDDPFPLNTWSHVCVNYTGGDTVSIYVNGVLNKAGDLNYDIDDTNHALNIGARYESGSFAHAADGTKLALVRISKSAPTPEQIKKIYNDEKCLYYDNAQATLYGTSDAVTALAHDDSNNILHVGTSAGRSEFQGLTRINNTTTAVTTAISASNGLVAEQ